MIEGQFSRTALRAAGFRAAHQFADGGRVFADPLAATILGDHSDILERCGVVEMRPLRLFIALRSRIAEDAARQAVADGARQIVILGAGLDTFALRISPVDGLAVYEVDHPATQAEKRRRLASMGLVAPAHLHFAPCDFERETLALALSTAGFVASARTAFCWLGVTPYLTPDAIAATLRFIAGISGGVDVVFDYTNPRDAIANDGHRRFHDEMAARVSALGEAFKGYFATADMHKLLADLGFAGVSDLGPREIAARLGSNGPPRPENGGHIVHAWKRP